MSQDETENGVRALLNLGHTFGRAIEAEKGYGNWLHGAVAVGSVQAAETSLRLSLLAQHDVDRIKALLVKAHLPLLRPLIWNLMIIFTICCVIKSKSRKTATGIACGDWSCRFVYRRGAICASCGYWCDTLNVTSNDYLILPTQTQLVSRSHLIGFSSSFIFLSGTEGSGRSSVCQQLMNDWMQIWRSVMSNCILIWNTLVLESVLSYSWYRMLYLMPMNRWMKRWAGLLRSFSRPRLLIVDDADSCVRLGIWTLAMAC